MLLDGLDGDANVIDGFWLYHVFISTAEDILLPFRFPLDKVLLILSEDATKRIRNLADARVGTDGIQDVGHQVIGPAGSLCNRLKPLLDQGIVPAGLYLLDLVDLRLTDCLVDA